MILHKHTFGARLLCNNDEKCFCGMFEICARGCRADEVRKRKRSFTLLSACLEEEIEEEVEY